MEPPQMISVPSPVVGQTSRQVQFTPDPIFFTWLRVEGTRRKRTWRPGDAPSVGHQTSRLIIVRSSPRATEDARASDAHKSRALGMHLQKIAGLPAVPLPGGGSGPGRTHPLFLTAEGMYVLFASSSVRVARAKARKTRESPAPGASHYSFAMDVLDVMDADQLSMRERKRGPRCRTPHHQHRNPAIQPARARAEPRAEDPAAQGSGRTGVDPAMRCEEPTLRPIGAPATARGVSELSIASPASVLEAVGRRPSDAACGGTYPNEEDSTFRLGRGVSASEIAGVCSPPRGLRAEPQPGHNQITGWKSGTTRLEPAPIAVGVGATTRPRRVASLHSYIREKHTPARVRQNSLLGPGEQAGPVPRLT
ncbi:hypothetical protein VTO73DRAFT_2480 [Trametes versicolor]